MPARPAPRVGWLAIVLATLLGASMGVVVHLIWPEVGAAGGVPAPMAQVAGEQLQRGDEPSEVQTDRLGGGIVLVETSGCGVSRQASATVVQTEGGPLVVTNAHVVRGSGTATVRTGDGSTWQADVVGAVAGRDAAVLRLSDDSAPLVAMAAAASPSLGDTVAVAGYPEGRATVRVGPVVSIEVRSGYGGSTDVMVIDTATGDGQSGGAVLDAAGRVVGLVAARDPDTGDTVAYPIDAVLRGTLAAVPTC